MFFSSKVMTLLIIEDFKYLCDCGLEEENFQKS